MMRAAFAEVGGTERSLGRVPAFAPLLGLFDDASDREVFFAPALEGNAFCRRAFERARLGIDPWRDVRHFALIHAACRSKDFLCAECSRLGCNQEQTGKQRD